MELLALLSDRDDVIVLNVKETLKRYTVYPLKTVGELEDLYSNIPLNILLIDTVSHRLSSLEDILGRLDDSMVVLITPEKLDKFSLENLPPSVYDCIDVDSIRNDLPVIIERALERQRFKNELTLLKQTRDDPVPVQMPVYSKSDVEMFSGRYDSFSSGRYLQEKVIVNFAKMLTVSFDMHKLFNYFMDSVMEIVRVNKMSVMLRDNEGFHIKTHYGLDQYIADNLKLKKESALILWLAKTGRIMQKPINPADTVSINIKTEMELLQCTFSFPMTHKGKLIGVFNVDNKITEESFYREELEIIYVLCNYLAAAVKDIDIYHQMWYQKEFTKNIISSMTSGMITIDRDEKITTFNQQASEILNLDSSEIIGGDLRRLPSPLGDILYETMTTGASYKRYEVEIHPAKLPIGINSYRLLDEQQNPIGAGIVFSDLSGAKKLEEQLRRAEKLQAINDIMAKIAHEVRNPMTSIQTYIQLLNEQERDGEMRDFFISTVRQSIYTLDSLIDKLVTFSNALNDDNFNKEKEDINLILNEAGDYVSTNIPQTHKFSKQGIDKSFFINADKKLLIKAIYYLVLSIVDRTPQSTLIAMSAKTIIKSLPFVEISIKYEGDEFTDEEKQSLLRPLSDIDNLGTELNVPISNKIIERHNGSLDMKRESGSNIFIVKLPVIDRRGAKIQIEREHISGQQRKNSHN